MKVLLKIPVLLVIFFSLVMVGVDWLGIGLRQQYGAQKPLAFGLLGLGFVILLIAGYSFRRAKTTVNPLYPEKASSLVTGGIYQYSRNPMYVAFLLWLLACLIYIGNLLNLLWLPLYIYLANLLYIIPEERALLVLFGEDYRNYQSRVRRWI